jgi:hypothetical protein
MKKTLLIGMIVLSFLFLQGCQKTDETIQDNEIDVYRLLMDAEDLSGMTNKTKSIITVDGDLGLPMSYHGVTITYASRNASIISNLGVVTRPNECWIESRDQQGLNPNDYQNLNDNWPILLDVTLTYEGQSRTAKLLFVVAPREGFTCQKYLG